MTFEADSPVATMVSPALGHRRGKFGPRRSSAAIIIHTTGSGPVTRWRGQGERFGEASPFETALRIYGTMMEAAGHYVVGQGGECAQTAPEDAAAWHVGRQGAGVYARATWGDRRQDWWRARWPGFGSPLELAGGELWIGVPPVPRACNPNAYGIEVVPPADDPQGPWSDACWDTIVRLARDISERRRVPLEREHVLGHSDAHPVARTTDGGVPWDPWPAQWAGWETFAERAGLPIVCGPYEPPGRPGVG